MTRLGGICVSACGCVHVIHTHTSHTHIYIYRGRMELEQHYLIVGTKLLHPGAHRMCIQLCRSAAPN